MVVSQMSSLPATIYLGGEFDSNVSAIVAIDPKNASAVREFCSSPEYERLVRQIEPSMKANNAVLVKVPFEIERWREEASQNADGNIENPFSTDPTQWVFHGHPANTTSASALHAGLAHLLGYRWPAQSDPDMQLSDDARGMDRKSGRVPARRQ